MTQATVHSFFAQLVAILVVFATSLGMPRQIGPAATQCAWCPIQDELTSASALSLSPTVEDAPLSSKDGPRDGEEKQDYEEERGEGKLLALPRDASWGTNADRVLALLTPSALGLSAGRTAPVMVFRPPC